MSHVAEVELHVTDLEALKDACSALGMQFIENQKTHRWYGVYMGDSILPAGFTPDELGKCDHAIAVPDNPRAYEIGVTRRRDGKPGYALYYDNWYGGYGLEEKAGVNACKLKQEYAAQVAGRQLTQQGYRVRRTITQEGRIRLAASR